MHFPTEEKRMRNHNAGILDNHDTRRLKHLPRVLRTNAFLHPEAGRLDRHPENFAARITFSEPLSRRFYAAADVFLMPSEFEPCGLAQMISMRYATLPLVRETGGLKDTVSGYWDAGENADGFSFKDFDANGLRAAVDLALELWFEHPDTWRKLQFNALGRNFSWEESAEKYRELYDSLW